MDRQYLAGVLLAVCNIQSGRPHATRSAAVDAFYERHASADGFAPKAVTFFVAAVFTLVVVGVWPM